MGFRTFLQYRNRLNCLKNVHNVQHLSATINWGGEKTSHTISGQERNLHNIANESFIIISETTHIL